MAAVQDRLLLCCMQKSHWNVAVWDVWTCALVPHLRAITLPFVWLIGAQERNDYLVSGLVALVLGAFEPHSIRVLLICFTMQALLFVSC